MTTTSEHNKALIVEASAVMNVALMGKRLAIVGGFPRDVLARRDAKDIDIMVLDCTNSTVVEIYEALCEQHGALSVMINTEAEYTGSTEDPDSTLIAVIQYGNVDILCHSTGDAREVLRQFDCNINQFIFHNNGAIVFGGDHAPDQAGLVWRKYDSLVTAKPERCSRMKDIYAEMEQYL